MGVQYKFGPSEKMESLLQKVGSFGAAATRELKGATQKSVVRIQTGTRAGAPVGVSGRLRNSIEWKVTEGGSAIIGWVGSTLRNEVYPAIMEAGRRRGHMPPPKALQRWVHIVLGVPEKEVRSVAYLVARSIAKKGIRGRRFLLRAYLNARPFIDSYFREALERLAGAVS